MKPFGKVPPHNKWLINPKMIDDDGKFLYLNDLPDELRIAWDNVGVIEVDAYVPMFRIFLYDGDKLLAVHRMHSE